MILQNVWNIDCHLVHKNSKGEWRVRVNKTSVAMPTNGVICTVSGLVVLATGWCLKNIQSKGNFIYSVFQTLPSSWTCHTLYTCQCVAYACSLQCSMNLPQSYHGSRLSDGWLSYPNIPVPETNFAAPAGNFGWGGVFFYGGFFLFLTSNYSLGLWLLGFIFQGFYKLVGELTASDYRWLYSTHAQHANAYQGAYRPELYSVCVEYTMSAPPSELSSISLAI